MDVINNKCPYCHHNLNDPHYELLLADLGSDDYGDDQYIRADVDILEHGTMNLCLSTDDRESETDEISINFCPMCGRKLGIKMIISEDEAIKRFLNKLRKAKWDYSVIYHDGEIERIEIPAMIINLDAETVSFNLGLDEFEGFKFIAEQIELVNEFIKDLQNAKENNGNHHIEDTSSLINGK